MRPVKIHVPEGTILNCKYPAACGAAPRIGNVLVSTVCEGVAKMIYASGRYDDVNASTTGNLEFVGGPGYFYGGHTREGIPVAQGLYDIHGAGMGAAPRRDGVNTGGHMNIPSAGISDIERIEMQYPFLYFTRSHNCDGSGFGQYRGGMGSYRIYLIYGSKDCSVDYKPYGGVAQGGFGLSGGYPTGIGANRVMIEAGLEMLDKIRKGDHPTGQAMRAGEWGKSSLPAGVPERIPLPEGSLLVDYVAGGGGFGDPIDRAPQAVLKDFGRGWVSRETAERVYGVILSSDGKGDRRRCNRNTSPSRSVNLASKALRRFREKPAVFQYLGAMAGDKHCDSTPRWRCVPTASRKLSAAVAAATCSAMPRKITSPTPCIGACT